MLIFGLLFCMFFAVSASAAEVVRPKISSESTKLFKAFLARIRDEAHAAGRIVKKYDRDDRSEVESEIFGLIASLSNQPSQAKVTKLLSFLLLFSEFDIVYDISILAHIAVAYYEPLSTDLFGSYKKDCCMAVSDRFRFKRHLLHRLVLTIFVCVICLNDYSKLLPDLLVLLEQEERKFFVKKADLIANRATLLIDDTKELRAEVVEIMSAKSKRQERRKSTSARTPTRRKKSKVVKKVVKEKYGYSNAEEAINKGMIYLQNQDKNSPSIITDLYRALSYLRSHAYKHADAIRLQHKAEFLMGTYGVPEYKGEGDIEVFLRKFYRKFVSFERIEFSSLAPTICRSLKTASDYKIVHKFFNRRTLAYPKFRRFINRRCGRRADLLEKYKIAFKKAGIEVTL